MLDCLPTRAIGVRLLRWATPARAQVTTAHRPLEENTLVADTNGAPVFCIGCKSSAGGHGQSMSAQGEMVIAGVPCKSTKRFDGDGGL